jgi:hypothetical protein
MSQNGRLVPRKKSEGQQQTTADKRDGGTTMADTTDPLAAEPASSGRSRSVVGHGRLEREAQIPTVEEPEQLRLDAEPGRAKTTIPRDWRTQTVVSVPVAGRLLDLSRQGAYDAANRGELPAIRIGRRLVVPVVKLRRLLGELPAAEEVSRGEDAQ